MLLQWSIMKKLQKKRLLHINWRQECYENSTPRPVSIDMELTVVFIKSVFQNYIL